MHSVVIAKRNGLSQGYGFVQFMKRSDAQKSIRNMQNSVLEGHTIEIKLSEKTLAYVLQTHACYGNFHYIRVHIFVNDWLIDSD